MSLKFGTDGVRGRALTELTTGFVTMLGAAAARVLGDGPWLVARDTRESGEELQQALWHGLHLFGGAQVTMVDVLPTPAVSTRRNPSGPCTT